MLYANHQSPYVNKKEVLRNEMHKQPTRSHCPTVLFANVLADQRNPQG